MNEFSEKRSILQSISFIVGNLRLLIGRTGDFRGAKQDWWSFFGFQ